MRVLVLKQRSLLSSVHFAFPSRTSVPFLARSNLPCSLLSFLSLPFHGLARLAMCKPRYVPYSFLSDNMHFSLPPSLPPSLLPSVVF
jgi:hypothetical protein